MKLGFFLKNEARFLLWDRVYIFWLLTILVLAAVSIYFGLVEISEQRQEIQQLQTSADKHLQKIAHEQGDWGGLAYYSFHLTYDPPSEFAHVALGVRDSTTWKHRIRMLALQGQIHERDVENPITFMVGRLDYAFFVAFILPLILIIMLHDIKFSERHSRRYELLELYSTELFVKNTVLNFWIMRLLMRSLGILLATLLPLWLSALLLGVPMELVLLCSALIVAYVVFWASLCFVLASWQRHGTVIASSLIGIWLVLTIVVPASGTAMINHSFTLPHSSTILLAQREKVNAAWDLPKQATMRPFVHRYPEWANYTEVNRPFEWKWYYAFQQVGDQQVEQLVRDYNDGIRQRDRLAGQVAWLSPPALVQRTMQKLGQTDVSSWLAYQDRIYKFHTELRHFYYSKLFLDAPYDRSQIKERPTFHVQ